MKTIAEVMTQCLATKAEFGVVIQIARAIREAGGRVFLVGGCVRDALRGEVPGDFDIEVYGVTEACLREILERSYRIDAVGMSFGVIKLAGYDIDVSLPRRESRTGRGHRGFLVEPEPSLTYEEACARRDFTMNAILWDPLSDELVDPFGGVRDIREGILRHVSEHFCEDSLRVLRAMQFVARMGYRVAPETVAICRGMRQDDLPRERLAAEWEKLLLAGQRPSLGLQFLRACGWVRYYPELNDLIGCEQYPLWHPEGDVWAHTLQALDAVVDYRKGDVADDLLLAVAVLCHDFGKPLVTERQLDGRITSYGHELAGASRVRTFVGRLWNTVPFADAVERLVAGHMRPMALVQAGGNPRAYRRLAVAVGRMDLLADLMACDMRGTLPNPVDETAIATFREQSRALNVADRPPEPWVMGRHLIARGLTPGPVFGEILRMCYEGQLDGVFEDLEGGLVYLDEVLRRRT